MPNICLLRTRMTLRDLKRIAKLKEIPRNGVTQWIEIAPNDLLILQLIVNLKNVKNVSARNTKYF